MKKLYCFLPAVLVMLLFINCAENRQKAKTIADLTAPGATVKRLADGFTFTEGPASDSAGNVYFTDQSNNKIFKWSTDNRLSVFHDSPQRANGLYFDLNGDLLACADLYFKLVAIDMQGNIKVLVDNYNGKNLNAPNDLWVDPKGGIYFTDPYYQRDYWERTQSEIDCECVYYLKPDRKTLIRVIDDFVKPNGVIGSPDGKILYVADIGDSKTYSYTINEDGTLANKKLLAPEGSDGMTIDNLGNVYLTNKAVSVFAADGVKIGEIAAPERPANVCFGGKNKDILFITARTSLYAIKMQVKGVQVPVLRI
ncbi:SMP-30/gluconolactonase/LRE family protein [candidate division KSB1 bacterium]|nr:SMP-30/gluconolactonase/LRE family protein [candidate division KSB1 bacterium]